MTHAATATQEPLDVAIRTGDDLAAALRHPEPRVRIAVLRDVATDPERLARYGGGDGRDLVDELLLLCREAEGSADRVGYAYALLQMDGARATEFAKREFVHGDHAKLALVAAGRLAELPAHERVETLAPVVTGKHGPTRLRAAANLLADVQDLEPVVALRVALLTDHPVALPPVDASTLDAWLSELDGDRPNGARHALRTLGPSALRPLLEHWTRLPHAVRAWTLRWADEVASSDAEMRTDLEKLATPAVIAALTSDDGGLLGDALRLAGTLLRNDMADTRPGLSHAVRALDDHSDDEVRALALTTGADAPDPLGALAAEPSDTVQVRLIERLRFDPRPEAQARLGAALRNGAWRVRAVAASGLAWQVRASEADGSAPATWRSALLLLRAAFASRHEHARIAAGRALVELDDGEGLEAGL